MSGLVLTAVRYSRPLNTSRSLQTARHAAGSSGANNLFFSRSGTRYKAPSLTFSSMTGAFGFSFPARRSRFGLLWDMMMMTYSDEIPGTVADHDLNFEYFRSADQFLDLLILCREVLDETNRETN